MVSIAFRYGIFKHAAVSVGTPARLAGGRLGHWRMVGVDPVFRTHQGDARGATRANGRVARRWLIILATLVPVSAVMVQCGGQTAANRPPPNLQVAAAPADSFDDRFQATTFQDRFAGDTPIPQQPSPPPPARAAAAPQVTPAPYRVASLGPHLPSPRPSLREDQTSLVSLKSSAFPYFGNNPRTDQPFLNVSSGERRGHRGMGGRVFWQNETFNDSRTLMHIPRTFDVRKPGVIVVFFHGNGATLERDVRDRQQVPQQIADSGANAVLLAPQLAVNAADSSAGKFWQPGALKRFLAESADHLAEMYGDPAAAKTFASMPVVIVAYSGGFVPAAYSLEVGGLGNRVRGVFLLDALYGELDKFASWIETNRTGFFVSAYTRYTKRHDDELRRRLAGRGIAASDDMERPLRPGSVMFVETPNGVTHRDYVTRAWTELPVKEVLAKMADAPELSRVANVAARVGP